MNLDRVAFLLSSLVLAAAATAAFAHDVQAPAEQLAPRLQMPLPNAAGKTFTSAIVTFPPGAKAALHTHGDAFVYAYVLSGSVRSQLDDEPARIFRTGEEWHELPGAHHKVTENISKSSPARLLVVFVATTGAQLKQPD